MLDNNNNRESTILYAPAYNSTEQRAKIFAALSDPTRLRIVEMLTKKAEMSGSEIANEAGISLALLCHHSKLLAEAGVVITRKEGQTKYHTLNRGLLLNCFASFGEIAGV